MFGIAYLREAKHELQVSNLCFCMQVKDFMYARGGWNTNRSYLFHSIMRYAWWYETRVIKSLVMEFRSAKIANLHKYYTVVVYKRVLQSDNN
jgi:hypothetical protein